MRNKEIMTNKMLITCLAIMFGLSGCSGYKSTWDCPKLKGIGCSSLEYADEVAREQILLNTINASNASNASNATNASKGQKDKSKIEKKEKILLKQDLLSSGEHEDIYQEIEVQ